MAAPHQHSSIGAALAATRYEPQAQAMCGQASPPPPVSKLRFDEHVDELCATWDRLAQLVGRTEAVADRLLGQAPAEAQNGCAEHEPSCVSEHFERLGRRFLFVEARLRVVVERLERA